MQLRYCDCVGSWLESCAMTRRVGVLALASLTTLLIPASDAWAQG